MFPSQSTHFALSPVEAQHHQQQVAVLVNGRGPDEVER